MPPVTPELQEAARISIPRIEARLVPADPEWTTGAVVALLTHYYTAQLPAAVYGAIKADWIACLAEFPQWTIEDARLQWLKKGRRKPIPSDIFTLCARIISKERAALFLCRRILATEIKPSAPEMTTEERAASKARVADLVRQAVAGSLPAESGAM